MEYLLLVFFFEPGEIDFAVGVTAEVAAVDATSLRGAYLVFGVVPSGVAFEEDVVEFFERLSD